MDIYEAISMKKKITGFATEFQKGMGTVNMLPSGQSVKTSYDGT